MCRIQRNMSQRNMAGRLFASLGILLGFWLADSSHAEPITLAAEAQRRSAEASVLRPGVVFDPSGVVYSMSPEGAVDAVSVDSGELLWSRSEAAVPLVVHGNLLLAQGPAAERDGTLDIVLLDRTTGELSRRFRMELPEGVWARVDDGLAGRFEVRTVVRAGKPFVSWEQTERRLRGVAPGPEERSGQKVGGAYRLDLQTGRAVAVELEAAAAPKFRLPDAVARSSGPLSRTPAPAGDVLAATRTSRGRIVLERWSLSGQPLPEVELFSGPYVLEMRSADGRHLLVAERVAPGPWEPYRWVLFSLENGRRLGQVRARQSNAWYVVHDSTLVHVAAPFDRRTEEGWVAKPLRLAAVSLATGALLWERELRETAFRGPFPP